MIKREVAVKMSAHMREEGAHAHHTPYRMKCFMKKAYGFYRNDTP